MQSNFTFCRGPQRTIVFASEDAHASWLEVSGVALREDWARCCALLREIGDVGWTEREDLLRHEKDGIYTLLAGRILVSGWFVVKSKEFVIALVINSPRPARESQLRPKHMKRILQEKELY